MSQNNTTPPRKENIIADILSGDAATRWQKKCADTFNDAASSRTAKTIAATAGFFANSAVNIGKGYKFLFDKSVSPGPSYEDYKFKKAFLSFLNPFVKTYCSAMPWAWRSAFAASILTPALLATDLATGARFTRVAGEWSKDALMATTTRTEEFYTFGTDIVDDEKGIYMVSTGKDINASNKNARQMKIEPDLFFLIFKPQAENIYAPIPSDMGFAQIKHTWFRFSLFNWINIYPEVKGIKITPLNELDDNHPAARHMRLDSKEYKEYIKTHPIGGAVEVPKALPKPAQP